MGTWTKNPAWLEIIREAEQWWDEARRYLPDDDPPARLSNSFGARTYSLMEWCTRETNIDPSPLSAVLWGLRRFHDGQLSRNDLEPLIETADIIMHRLYWLGTQKSPPAALPNEDRDRWLYAQAVEGTGWKAIKHTLAVVAPTKGWEPITTIEGLRKAAQRYAAAHHLPAPPKRQRGRRAK